MSRRLPHGGSRIDRSRPVTLVVDGVPVEAYAGDTVASAILAGDHGIVSAGIYTARPRGIMGIGQEEANAFVQVTSGAGEPLALATAVEVYDGLAIERVAGRGWLADGPDPSRYDLTYAHAEVAVVGGGLAGLRAAAAAARRGARVILLEDQPVLGGAAEGLSEVAALAAELAPNPLVRMLTRTTVTGSHGHRRLVAVQRRTDHLGPAAPTGVARRRLWQVQAGEVVLATGAQERPMVFADNDRPGVMLACAAADYVSRFGVLAGDRAVVWTAHDAGLYAALELAAAGTRLVSVLDVRDRVASELARRFAVYGTRVKCGAQVVGTDGDADGRLTRVHTRSLDAGGEVHSYDVDLLAVSGGFNPAVQLFSHHGGRTRWSPEVAGFVPDCATDGELSVGGAAGDYTVIERWRTPLTAPETHFCADVADDEADRVFLDPQRDATLQDLRAAHAAGLSSVEHVKRFTTIGTAADQGKGFGVLAVGVLARELGRPIEEVGTTTYRPPLTPISFGVLAGRTRGDLSDPIRVTALHDRVSHAPMEDVGQWKRPWYFPRDDEGIEDAVRRECRAVRTGVGMMDASTLGKIVLQGEDVGVLLDLVYTNLFSTLAVGKVRYGLMCGPDGMVLDDGTTARLSEPEWMMSTTTGNAAAVYDWLEELLQTEWPELDVRLTSVTEQWSVVAVAGPRSREVVAAIALDLDCSAEVFGFMQWRETTVAGIPARIMRVSFSGELAYEINVASWYGAALWDAVAAAGASWGITPYGTETMHVLRAEKGFPIIGQDTDGTVTPYDLGMAWAVSKKKTDFIGRRSLQREQMHVPDRRQLVGLVPVDGSSAIMEGAQLVAHESDLRDPPVPMHGHVTSSYLAGAGGPFALALLDGGSEREGEVLDAVDDLVPVAVRVTGPVSYDPQGQRRDG